jgi:outer membrane lipoprotein-sorting protein
MTKLSESSARAILIACVFSIALAGCDKGENNLTKNASSTSAPAVDVGPLVERYRALDNSRDSVLKMRARIQGQDAGPPEIQMTVYRKRTPDNGKIMFIEFTAPAQERDRNALVTTSPQGDIEAVRYIQSGDNFVSAKGALNEDSLFGMTLQELEDGQPEKYDFKLIGEETSGSTPVYRIEGKLKPGAESKFSRLVMLLSKENNVAIVSEFYDNHNELVRRLTVERAEQVAGHWTRMVWKVDNIARQKKIEFETLEAKYDQNLSDALFSRDRLKKLSKQ